ncbi:hypothetical protein [Nonlabens sp. MB-3u-79]|uniref:hypothetical protein n=1 Tax=Nonlabens sp. MB-3u-79 TaxID=2058134 RepID=UPI0012FE53F4|nr:hypothetical protein [Nonlabens sp. MB-3u-79]
MATLLVSSYLILIFANKLPYRVCDEVSCCSAFAKACKKYLSRKHKIIAHILKVA